jgi:hypothetical protein
VFLLRRVVPYPNERPLFELKRRPTLIGATRYVRPMTFWSNNNQRQTHAHSEKCCAATSTRFPSTAKTKANGNKRPEVVTRYK